MTYRAQGQGRAGLPSLGTCKINMSQPREVGVREGRKEAPPPPGPQQTRERERGASGEQLGILSLSLIFSTSKYLCVLYERG